MRFCPYRKIFYFSIPKNNFADEDRTIKFNFIKRNKEKFVDKKYKIFTCKNGDKYNKINLRDFDKLEQKCEERYNAVIEEYYGGKNGRYYKFEEISMNTDVNQAFISSSITYDSDYIREQSKDLKLDLQNNIDIKSLQEETKLVVRQSQQDFKSMTVPPKKSPFFPSYSIFNFNCCKSILKNSVSGLRSRRRMSFFSEISTSACSCNSLDKKVSFSHVKFSY